jgi:hypothetical protein
MTFPFPYFGQGSAFATKQLNLLVVFAASIAAEELARLAATAPEPVRAIVRVGPRWIFLETGDAYFADARRFSGVPSKEAACAAVAAALEAWILEVNRSQPVALFFVDAIDAAKNHPGAWHAWSIEAWATRVRPIVAGLRGEGEHDHARWIADKFLQSGAVPGLEDVLADAAEDGPAHAGPLARRCVNVLRVLDRLGGESLSALGPYVELGYWACAAIHERIADVARLPAHVEALASACEGKEPQLRTQLLIQVAACLMSDAPPLVVKLERFPDRTPQPNRDVFPHALAIVEAAARFSAPTNEQIVWLLRCAAALGGDLEEPMRRALPTLPPEPVLEQPIAGASHPHLARLDAERLEVRYRGSLVPQLVEVRLRGSRNPNRDPLYGRAMEWLVDVINAGFGGGALFAPELGGAELLEGPRAGETVESEDFTWKLRLTAIDPRFLRVALHALGESWGALAGIDGVDVSHCPKHLSIAGELPLDDSPASARTDEVLGWLADGAEAYRAWPELPFTIKEGKPTKSPKVVVKVSGLDEAQAEGLAITLRYALVRVLDSHPASRRASSAANPVVGKTQIAMSFDRLSVPPELARGPILNALRRLHVCVAPIKGVELALG